MREGYLVDTQLPDEVQPQQAQEHIHGNWAKTMLLCLSCSTESGLWLVLSSLGMCNVDVCSYMDIDAPSKKKKKKVYPPNRAKGSMLITQPNSWSLSLKYLPKFLHEAHGCSLSAHLLLNVNGFSESPWRLWTGSEHLKEFPQRNSFPFLSSVFSEDATGSLNNTDNEELILLANLTTVM